NILFAANVLNTAPITTRGGYVIMDGTGGTIDFVNQTITMGTVHVGYLQNIYPQASINTTTNAGVVSATSTGGNFIAAGYDAVSGGGLGTYESAGAILNIGGFVNIQIKTAGTNSYGYVINYHGPGPINAAGNITITANSSSTGMVDQDIYLSTGTTLTSYTGSVNISNTSTGNGGGITINAAISAATGITINNTNVGAIGVQSNAAGTLTTTAGTISITSTSTGSGVYAESLAGLITAPKVTITGTNSTAGGLGASVTGGVTITNVAGTYASVGDALNITTTVGTNGTTGGINVTTGAITNNSNGGDVTFKTNGDITATSAVSFATANTTNHVQTLTYDTRTGNLNSQITAGIFTFNATGATSEVNYQILSNGSALTVPAVTVSGTILLDNTCASNASYTCSTPLTASSATTVNTTASVGISLTGAQTSGQGITINGINASASNAAVALGANGLTVTSAASFSTAGGKAISVIGLKNTANIGNPGITSTGALAVQSSGGDILFKSNGDVTQSGAVTLAANNTGHAQAVTYDVTSANQNASIVAGVLTYTASSSPASNPVNFSALASGGYLTVGATTVSGSITADNTYGCTGASCTPASGYLNMSTISTSNASTGVYVSGSLSAGSSITINGASASSAAGTADGAVTLAAITISGSQVRAGNQINISGFSNGASAGHGLAFEGNVTINSGTGPALVGGDINVLAVTSAPACCSGLWMNPTAVAKVSANAYGSSINFGTEATPIQGVLGINGYASSFNTLRATTVGGVGGNINIYAQSYASGYSAAYIAGTITADANVVVRASKTDAGLAVALNLSAAITSNNGSVSITGTTSSAAYYGASITGVINGYAGVTIFGGPNGAATGGGVSDTATITSAAGPVSITGISTTAMAVSDTALITGNSITVTGTGTTAATVVSLGAMTINACSAGVACNSNNISVTGNDSAAGNQIGITQTGAITDNASGGNILFKSNNQIAQNGTISIAQNTSGTPSSIVYDTTLGNKLSLINAGAVTFNGTSTSYINYSNITAGAEIIVNSALNVPGSITFDNTYINGVQGAINPTNAWNNATTASVAIPITASLTAENGIYIRGAVGATNNTAAPGFDAITITGGTAVAPIVLQTTGVFAAGADAINIVGIEPSQNTTKNAINIANYTQINNNSTAASGSSWGGNTNIVAYSGRYNDAITVTNASTAGALELSAIGASADIVTVAGTLFTQNSNAGVFIATSNNGNVTPPKIVNNGTGPVVIEAGAYFAAGTVNSACSATACGQITAISGNNITSPNGNVYLYAGSPGVTAGTTSTQASLGLLSPSLGDFTFSNTLFSQAYAAGNVAATSLPIFTLGGINTANVAGGTGGTSWNT
ncbi:hypothetical protein M2128_002267, partial [Polynucleobacter sphagniphilus]|uniref:beta strand repeat-containing protein n=1 Tax=Polynucleobacter sphagniphilus TaxID=1743169 RepID=UPI002472F52C